MPDLVTLGELCAVFVAKDIGRMRYCHEYIVRPGGAEATVAVGVKRLGFDAGWISVLGKDELGIQLRNLMRGEGVDVSYVKLQEGMNTGIFLRERLPGGNARHIYYRHDSAFTSISPDILNEDYIGSAKFLHLSGITAALSESAQATMWRAIEIARAKGVTVVYDPNIRLNLWSKEEAREATERFLEAADIVLPGLEDLQMLYGQIAVGDALEKLRALGCNRFVLKSGVKEVLVQDEDRLESVSIELINSPVDLMGAGDAFAAGLLGGLLRGRSLTGSARLGNLVARSAIQMPGNIESLPTWEEVSRQLTGEVVYNR